MKSRTSAQSKNSLVRVVLHKFLSEMAGFLPFTSYFPLPRERLELAGASSISLTPFISKPGTAQTQQASAEYPTQIWSPAFRAAGVIAAVSFEYRCCGTL
jgi:hypothetical protein